MKKKVFVIIRNIIIFLVLIVTGYLFFKYFKREKFALKKLSKKTKEFVLNDTNETLVFDKNDILYYKRTPIVTRSTPIIKFPVTPNETGTVIIYNEPENQNVHDSIVNRYVKTLYSGIENDSKYDIRDTIKEIEDFSKEKGVFDKITPVLQKIVSRNSTITNLDDTNEINVLSSVWNLAKNNENIKEYLLTQLEDCVENKYVVCPTGVVNRIVSSLAVNSPENFPKTQNIIKEEILNTTAHLRNELENDTAFTMLNDIEQKTFFTEKLLDKLYDDYSNIYDKEQIDKKIESMGLLEYL